MVKQSQVPTGFYHYDLRGSDDDPGEAITLESHVAVNHAGTVLSGYPIPVPERGYLNLGGGLDFTGGMVTTEQRKRSTIALNESLNTKEKKQELEERI